MAQQVRRAEESLKLRFKSTTIGAASAPGRGKYA